MPSILTGIGPETRVNSFTTGNQLSPSIAQLSDGSYVVVWHSADQDGSEAGVYGQKFSRDGTPFGGEFAVNTYTNDNQGVARVAALPGGGFVVTWTSTGQDGSDNGIYFQRFDANAASVGAETQANTFTDSNQSISSVTALEGGGFVVAWKSDGQDGSVDGIFARRFDADGAPAGGEFQINQTSSGNQRDPEIAALSGGGFIALWHSYAAGASGVYGRRYGTDGAAVGPEFRIDETAAGGSFPDVAVLQGGGIVATWMNGTHVYMRRFDRDGVALAGEAVVTPEDTGVASFPRIAALPFGGYVVTWFATGADGDGLGAFGRVFDAGGAAISDAFLINMTTAGDQLNPIGVGLDGGRLVFTWESAGQDGSGRGIFQQQFQFGLLLTEGSDTLLGSEGADVFAGNPAHLGASDTLSGGAGTDRLELTTGGTLDLIAPAGFSGIEVIAGSAGNDTITVSAIRLAGVTTISGGEGSDTIRLGAAGTLDLQGIDISGIERLEGSAGDDTIVANISGAVAAGGGGDDTYVVDDTGDSVVEAADEGTDTVRSGVAFTLGDNVEHLVLTGTGNTDGTGNALANRLTGNSGNNRLAGGAGDDTLTGNGGIDTFVYSGGSDVIADFQAGGGLDRVDLSAMSGIRSFAGLLGVATQQDRDVRLDLGDGNVLTLQGVTIGALIETDFVFAGAANLALTGTEADDILTGTDANETIDGLGGSDTIDAGGGDDVVIFDAADLALLAPSGDTKTPGAPLGGAGFDTLLIRNLAAPTDFDLTAHGFERARQELSDSDAQTAWRSISTAFDASWNRLSQSVVLDSGGRIATTFDAHSTASWTAMVEEFDAARLRTTRRTYADDLSYRFEYFDGAATLGWTGVVESFAVSGIRTSQDVTGQNGTTRNAAWAVIGDTTRLVSDIETDASGMRIVERHVTSEGITRVTYRSTGASGWSSIEEEYAADGQRSLQRVFRQDGSSTVQSCDLAHAADWTSIVEHRDTQGRRIEQHAVFDSGASLRTLYDVEGGGDATSHYSGSLEADTFSGAGGHDLLYGQGGADILDGRGGNDRLEGGAGDDTLIGGSGEDRFVYSDAGFGHDVITDFVAGAAGSDTLEFTASVFADWQAVLGAATQSGADTLITLNANDTITLRNVALADLNEDDIRIV